MPVKIRLARHGRKRRPFYYIIAADSRAPRDGRYIERIGSFNPNTEPATIDLNFDRALSWLLNGAQPTDTCKTILSNEGVLLKKHLLRGVKKEAITQEEADAKFNAWKTEKETKVQSLESQAATKLKAEADKKYEAEVAINNARKEAQAKKIADAKAEINAAAAAAAAKVAEASVAEEVTVEEKTEE